MAIRSQTGGEDAHYHEAAEQLLQLAEDELDHAERVADRFESLQSLYFVLMAAWFLLGALVASVVWMMATP